MTVWRRVGWLFVAATACAATVSGCGSASTGRASSEAVVNTVRDFAGPDAKVYESQVRVKNADDGSFRWIPMVVACKPEGGCQVVAPDGAGYPDLQAFVDDTKLIDPGDQVTGNANIASPDAPVRTETFVKRSGLPLAWVAGGALLVLLLAAVWLTARSRRRRSDEQTLRAWETPPGQE